MPITTPQGTLDFKKVDRVTFVGASSNTVIDTTTGSLGVGVGVGGPTSNLHVVGNTRLEGDINMLHTSNTASIKLNSNVVAEFPRSKKLIKYPRVALTSDNQPTGYVASASSYYTTSPTYAPWKAFDNIKDGNSWVSETISYNADGTATGASQVDTFETIPGSWLGIELPNKIKLEYVIIKNRDSATIRNVTDGIIWASNDGTTWFRIKDFSGLNTNRNAKNVIQVHQTIAYNEYRLQFTKIYPYGGSGGSASVGELELFGVPEYDPDAHGTDVVVKSVANVPNTDWLEVYYDAKNYTSGSTITDESPNSYVGTLNDNTQLETVDGIKAFKFDGNADTITGTVSGASGEYVHTITFWVKINDALVYTLFEMGARSMDDLIGISISSSTINYYFYSNDNSYTGITPGSWHHLTFTYSGGSDLSNRKLYINGNEIPRSTHGGASSGALTLANGNFTIGDIVGGTGLNDFKGSIANFRLFNRALSSDEIYQLYAYQKEDFGHGDLSMTLKAGRLGIGTSEPRAALDVKGDIMGGCPVFFRVNIETPINSTLTPTSGAPPIIWNNVSWNVGGGYNQGTGTFTAPIQGYYSFSHWAMTNGNQDLVLKYYINNAATNDLNPVRTEPFQKNSGNHTQNSGTTTFKMRAGDTIYIALTSGNIFVSAAGSAMYNNFEGCYLSSW